MAANRSVDSTEVEEVHHVKTSVLAEQAVENVFLWLVSGKKNMTPKDVKASPRWLAQAWCCPGFFLCRVRGGLVSPNRWPSRSFSAGHGSIVWAQGALPMSCVKSVWKVLGSEKSLVCSLNLFDVHFCTSMTSSCCWVRWLQWPWWVQLPSVLSPLWAVPTVSANLRFSLNFRLSARRFPICSETWRNKTLHSSYSILDYIFGVVDSLLSSPKP